MLHAGLLVRRHYQGRTIIIRARSVSSVRRGITVCVSGSPNRTLYSSTLGPSDVNMKPVKRSPTNGYPGSKNRDLIYIYPLFACHQLWVEDKFYGFHRELWGLRQEQGHKRPCRQCWALYHRRISAYGLVLAVRTRWCSRHKKIGYLSHRRRGILRLRRDHLGSQRD